MIGARVYAYTRRRDKARILEELGAEPVHSLDFYREKERVDVVVEIVGARTFNESIRSLRTGGVLVLVGNVEGEPIVIERPALLVMREIEVKGSATYTMEEYRQAVSLVGSGKIKAYYEAYRLEDVNKIYQDMAEGRMGGGPCSRLSLIDPTLRV